MKDLKLNPPMPGATYDFINDVVFSGGIDFSFSDYSEGTKVDFAYLQTILSEEAITDLTDKIKDLVMDALLEIEDNENEEDDN